MITLASKSAARSAILRGAGLSFETEDSGVDEDAIKADELARGQTPRQIAQTLAVAKASRVSAGKTGLVIGADQTLEFADTLYDKAPSLEVARSRLETMAGKTHQLHSAVVVAEAGDIVWSHCDTASLTFRNFSHAFLDGYLTAEGPEVLASVGGYRLEGLGAQLFSAIDGDYFSILGLPLMGLLAYLRERGALTI